MSDACRLRPSIAASRADAPTARAGQPYRSPRVSLPGQLSSDLAHDMIDPAKLLVGLRVLLVTANPALNVLLLVDLAHGFFEQAADDGAAGLVSLDQLPIDSLEQPRRHADREPTGRTHAFPSPSYNRSYCN